MPTAVTAPTPIAATGAESVWITHGYTSVLARYMREQGLDTEIVATRYEGERDAAADAELDADEVAAPATTTPPEG